MNEPITSENYFSTDDEKRTFEQMLSDFQEQTDCILSEYIKETYLVTLARILLYMSEKKANETLLQLDQDTRQKLTYLMNKERGNKKFIEFDAKNAFVVSDLSGYKELTALEAKRREQGVIDTETFDTFRENNPIFGEPLRRMHFEFGEMLYLDDLAIQKLMREIDSQELAISLCGTYFEFRNRFFRNMSARASGMLNDDIEKYEKLVNKHQVDEAREKICSMVLILEEHGEIVRPRRQNEISQAEIDAILAGED